MKWRVPDQRGLGEGCAKRMSGIHKLNREDCSRWRKKIRDG